MRNRATRKRFLPPIFVALVLAVAMALPTGAQFAAVTTYSYGYIGRLGGTLLGGPDANTFAPNVDVWVIGTDQGIWHRSFDGTTWDGWGRVPDGIATSYPSAVVFPLPPPYLPFQHIFVLGTDHAVWHYRSTNLGLPAFWESWGGIGTSDPDITSIAPNDLSVVVRGTDNALWLRQGTNSPWARIPQGIATSDAGVASAATNELDVFTRGTDNQLWFLRGTVAAGWMLPWTPLGGVLTSGPDAASCTPGHLDVVVRGTDNGYWRRGWDGTSWTQWEELKADYGGQQVAGTWTSDPGITCGGAAGMYVFGRDTSDALTYFTESAT